MRPMMAHIVLSATCRPSLRGVPFRIDAIRSMCSWTYGLTSSASNVHGTAPVILVALDVLHATPLVPTIRSSTRSLHPFVCRHMLITRTPFGYSNSTAKWSKMLPNCGATRTCRPPMPITFFGIAPIAQLTTSMLCTCCSTMWSPESQLK